MALGVGPDQKVGENAPRTGVAWLSAGGGIGLKCSLARLDCHAGELRQDRGQRVIARRPERIPGLPMPRYFSNRLPLLRAQTRIASPSLSNTN